MVEADQHPRQGGLAAAGFADDAEGSPRFQGQAHSAHRVNGRQAPAEQRAAAAEAPCQSANLHQCRMAHDGPPSPIGNRQRTSRAPPSKLVIPIAVFRQSSRTLSQRSAKAQPGGNALTAGGNPAIASRRRSGSPSTGTQSINLRVYG